MNTQDQDDFYDEKSNLLVYGGNKAREELSLNDFYRECMKENCDEIEPYVVIEHAEIKRVHQ